MSDWLDTLLALGRARTASVLVTVATGKGSTPREAGAKMIVTGDALNGSVGGGQLEYEAIRAARTMLEAGGGAALQRFALGPGLGQCCGGVAELLFEPVSEAQPGWVDALDGYRRDDVACVMVTAVGGDAATRGDKILVTESGCYGTWGGGALEAAALQRARPLLQLGEDSSPLLEQPAGPVEGSAGEPILLLFERDRRCDFRIFLFGAGHVGKALVSVLREAPCRITWVDGRDGEFPTDLPANVAAENSDAPEYLVCRAPPGSYFLVMTHSHPLDLRLCEEILARDDFRYFGLIGSRSKRKRFEKRLLRKGISAASLKRMACPIGVRGIKGKHPSTIAIAVAAEMLQVREQSRAMNSLSRVRDATPGIGQ